MTAPATTISGEEPTLRTFYVLGFLGAQLERLTFAYPIGAVSPEAAADQAAAALVPGCEAPHQLRVRVWEPNDGPLCLDVRYHVRPEGFELVPEDAARLARWGFQAIAPAEPKLGDCVELEDGTRAVISVGPDYGPDWLGICELGRASIFYGESHRGDGRGEYVSVSGGPHPGIRRARFLATGETADIRCWRWKDRPRAGGGEDYTRTVPLWRLAPADPSDDGRR
jgi:hypothetical protein